MTTLEKFLNAALLGTERQLLVVSDLSEDEATADLLKRLPSEYQSFLLRGAAICTAYRRAGRLPQIFSGTLPEPAQPDSKPEVSPGAAAILERILKGQYPDYLTLWLALANNAGLVAPGQYLPLLLDIAASSMRQRAAIMAVMGTRGAWLAKQNPSWKAMVTETAGWTSDRKEQRLDYFQRLRHSDSAAARVLLQESWKELGGPERAELVQGLSVNASMEDHQFLESLLDEKRADIRQAAADVLLTLPESHLVRRMIERSRMIVRAEKSLLKGTRLVVDLPADCDAAMQRDGMNGKSTKARRLTQIIESVPVNHWEQELELTPAKFLVAALKTDFAKEILQGISRSAARTANASWAAAIIQNQDVMKQVDLQDVSGMLLSLPAASREDLVERLVAAKADAATSLLAITPAPWGESLSRAALEHVLKPLATRQSLDYTARELLTHMANGLSSLLSFEVLPVATAGTQFPSPANQWNNFSSRYTFRVQLEKEFSL